MNGAEQAFRGAVARINDQRGKPAILGKTDGTLYWVSPAGTTYRTRVWARIGEEASRQEQVVDCLAVSPQLDMPVRVDHVNGILTVIDIDNRWYAEFSGDRPGGKVGAHAWLHSRLGPDPLFLSGLQYLPLLVTPTNPADLTVTVQGGAYMLDDGSLQFLETAVSGSLSSYVPGSGYHFVIVCLDRPNDAIVIVDGADVSNSSDALFGKATVSKADIEAVSISTDYWPLAVVLLYAGQTQITARDITHDLRPGNSGGGSGSPAGSDAQIQYNNGGAFGGDSGLTFNDSTKVVTLTASQQSDSFIDVVHNGTVSTSNERSLDFYAINSGASSVLYTSLAFGSPGISPGFEFGSIAFSVRDRGSMVDVLKVDPFELVFNEDGADRDSRWEGDSSTHLLVTDGGLDAVQIGTTTAGDIADFRSSAIVFNNSESDRDLRIAGSGVTNGVFYDGGNNRTGFNTGSPQAPVHIIGGDEIARFDHTSATGNPFISLFQNGTRRSFIQHADTDDNLIIASEYGTVTLKPGSAGTEIEGITLSTSEIVANNGESDINYRIAGNGFTNGYFYDAGNNRHGFGTASPSFPIHSIYDGGNNSAFETYSDTAAVGAVHILRKGRGTTASPSTVQNGDTLGGFAFGGYQSGFHNPILIIGSVTENWTGTAHGAKISFQTTVNTSTARTEKMWLQAGLVVGSPTGGDKGAGTVNASAVYDDNTLLTDYVFEPDYPLLSIDAMTSFYQSQKHLPTIPGRDEWERNGKFSLGKLANHLWETIEAQAIYISQLNERVKELEHGN